MTEQVQTTSLSQRKIAVRAVLRTDVGLVRTENQDFGVLTTAEEERKSGAGQLLVVADGMGGHRGGATASRLAGETVKEQYLATADATTPEVLRASLLRANARIFNESLANPELRGMGTTTSALAVKDGKGWFAHVGDSRIYMIRRGEITQLTDDHSLVATMVREGLLTPKEAETHPRRNVLQRSMGVAEDVEIDVKGPIELEEGDIFVLCSDGLHGLVKPDEILEIAGKMPIENAANEYLRLALQRGAPDNVTLIVAQAEARDGDEPSLDHAAFEETLRDVALPPIADKTVEIARPAAPKPAPEPAVTPAPEPAQPTPPAEEPVIETAGQPALETAGPAVEPKAQAGGSRLLWWILIIAIAAGAAGIWYFSPARGAGTSRQTTVR